MLSSEDKCSLCVDGYYLEQETLECKLAPSIQECVD